MFENLEIMIGRTFKEVTAEDDCVRFVDVDGNEFSFYHDQDCCESVYLEDVCGDLNDLIGSPLLVAEERTNSGTSEDGYDSVTWTFYTFRTIRGSVDIRWYGSSNGYYSESVNLHVTLAT